MARKGESTNNGGGRRPLGNVKLGVHVPPHAKKWIQKHKNILVKLSQNNVTQEQLLSLLKK